MRLGNRTGGAMIDDLRRIGGGPPLEADICIIGAGAAGISIAREFVRTRFRICLVESGGLDYEDDTQRLYEGENIGLTQYGMNTGRLRFFGGTTNHWGGRCTPLDELDFAERPWVPNSGWPIDGGALDPYYHRARDLCGLGPDRSMESVLSSLGVTFPALRPNTLQPKLWQYAPYPWSFGVVYREELRAADNILVLLQANVTRIAATPEGNAATAVTVTALDGVTRDIRARAYVLCCGAIENARLLLATSDGESPGLGNWHDLVGRFYMDHLRAQTGVIVTAERLPAIEDVFNYFTGPDRTLYQIGLALSAATQCERGLLNGCAILEYEGDPNSGITEAQKIWRELQHGRWADDIGEKVWRVLRDMDVVVANLHRRLDSGRHPLMPLKSASIVVDLEQAPNPESRVTLSTARDALGQQQTRLNWRSTSLERQTAEQFTTIIAVEMTRLQFGRCRLAPSVEPSCVQSFQPSEAYHHMGTTRMADDPRRGVVDRTCRVHGVHNLYVAGSSVFPTGGHANPTLTIVALALRLSDHLRTALLSAHAG